MSTPADDVTEVTGDGIEAVELPDQHRFVVRRDGAEAELVYRKTGRRLSLLHTEVPEPLGGQGVGGILVEAAVALAAAEDLTVVPWCPFAHRYLERHPDVAARVTVHWPPSPTAGPSASPADALLDEEERESFPASDPHSDWAGPDTPPEEREQGNG